MEKQKNMPQLRFPEFDGEWGKKKLGEVMVEGKLGGNYENSESNKGVPVIKMGNIGRGDINLSKVQYLPKEESYNEDDILKDGDLLFNTRNTLELVGKVTVWKNELPFALYNSNIMRMVFNEQFEQTNRFLNLLFNTKKSIKQLRSFATGTTSVAAIYGRDLVSLRFSYPSLPEQQKIASFFTTVNNKISQLKREKILLEQYKKGVMQKIFSQEIRFKDDNRQDFPKWEKIELGDLLIHKTTRNKESKVTLVLSVSNTKGFITQSEQFDNHRVASVDVSNYKIVLKNDFAYNPSRINVGSIARLTDYNVGIVSPMYVVFELKNALNAIFFENWIDTHKFKYLVKTSCSGTVRDSLNFEDMCNFSIKLPSLHEQTKIANFLSAVDEKINRTQKQIDKAEVWKKGLMQQMFV